MSGMIAPPSRVLLGLVALLWAADLILEVNAAAPALTADFNTYWDTARRILDGGAVYAPFELAGPFSLSNNDGVGLFVYTPVAALMMVPLAALSAWPSFVVFSVASLVALWAVAVAIVRREGLRDPWSFRVITLLVFVNGSTINSVTSGNLNTFVAALVGLMWLVPGGSGYLAVVGGIVKLFPGAGLAWAWRQRASLLGPVVAGVALVGVSMLLLGPTSWTDFFTAVRHFQGDGWFPIQSPAHVFGPVVGWACAGLLLAGTLRVRDDALAFGLLSLAMIAPAPDLWSHYLLIPMIGWLPFVTRRVARRRVTA
jgi:alpha-1,2-mannosyltransferase